MGTTMKSLTLAIFLLFALTVDVYPQQFTPEEYQMLEELEQDMISGRQPFVWYNSQRLAVTPEAMEYFGLETGDVVTTSEAFDIFEFHLEQLELDFKHYGPSQLPQTNPGSTLLL